MPQRQWVHLSDWLGYLGFAVMFDCMAASMYKFSWMKQARAEPEKGWVYRIAGGGYGTYQESLQSEVWFGSGFSGIAVAFAGMGIRIRRPEFFPGKQQRRF